MNLVRLEISGFKSFAKKTAFDFGTSVVGIVGPNGSGKSNVAEAIRFVLGEQSMKSMRGKRGEDLIWNGSNASPRAARASVSMTLNNNPRLLDIDFDEVTIERVVNRDGTNEYVLNGSTVRLKDILGLLTSANIGESGHHIISQGEADKILAASPSARREMLEDALGLKVYQYKKEESVRKLDKTEENMRQVEALKREVAPHLKFLKRQVEKVQRAEDLKTEATGRFREYFAEEDAYLRHAAQELKEKKARVEKELAAATASIKHAREALAKSSDSTETQKIVALSLRIEQLRAERQEVLKEASRAAGQLEALKEVAPESTVRREDLEVLIRRREHEFSSSSGALESLVSFVKEFFADLKKLTAGTTEDTGRMSELSVQVERAEAKERAFASEETEVSKELDAMRTALDQAKTAEREQERALFTLTADERELRHAHDSVESELARLTLEEDEYKRELGEAGVLIGHGAVDFAPRAASTKGRDEQTVERRELQKIKIRLEEMGGAGSADVLKEYQEASERDQFLERELADLTHAAAGLRELIANLEQELSTRFKEGMGSINEEFTKFFALMFDGGHAALTFVKEPVKRIMSLEDDNDDGVPDDMEKVVEGIDIALSIPRKRIKSLVMLSGGERALTSIALIFAMSSVNPPPFVVLDETDAALDEANSRRYGDMVEALSKKSQLVVITHNRETMSRAGILYGITMGGDGVSKVLSVKLEEAVKVAK